MSHIFDWDIIFSWLLCSSCSYVPHSMYLKKKRIGLVKKISKMSLGITQLLVRFQKFSVNIFSRQIFCVGHLSRIFFKVSTNFKFSENLRYLLVEFSPLFLDAHIFFQNCIRNLNNFYRISSRKLYFAINFLFKRKRWNLF